MNKICIYFFILLLSCVSVFAVSVPVNESYMFWADITENGQFYPSQNATITLINPQHITVINSEDMIYIQDGLFVYNYTFTTSGEWFGFVEYYNSTNDVVAISTATITVTEVEEMDLTTLYVIGFGVLLIFIAQYIKSYVFFIFSGVWFLANATYLMTIDILNFSWIFYFALSIYLIYLGINYSLRERKIKKIGTVDDERD